MLNKWWRILARPHTILAVFALIVAVYVCSKTITAHTVTRTVVQLTPDSGEAASTPSEQLSQALTELKNGLGTMVWPAELAVPLVFFETVDRQPTAVLSFTVPSTLALPVQHEVDLLAHIEKTALAHGAARVLILHDGVATGVFLHHVAVRTEL